jgi:hypothetical protein
MAAYINIYIFVYLYLYLYLYVYIYTVHIYMLLFQTENGKRKPRQFSLIHLPFAHHANGSLSFVSLFTMKQMEDIRLQTDQTD